jgi:hypothetical protein
MIKTAGNRTVCFIAVAFGVLAISFYLVPYRRIVKCIQISNETYRRNVTCHLHPTMKRFYILIFILFTTLGCNNKSIPMENIYEIHSNRRKLSINEIHYVTINLDYNPYNTFSSMFGGYKLYLNWLNAVELKDDI